MTRNIAPGYCVVERAGSLEHQARELFRDTRAPAVTMFMQLNAALVKAGTDINRRRS